MKETFESLIVKNIRRQVGQELEGHIKSKEGLLALKRHSTICLHILGT